MGALRQKLAVCIAVAAVVVTASSCRSATEVVVEARTNAAYRDGFVVSFTVGTPDEVENGAPTTESRDPWGGDGFVGSLTVVPDDGSSKDTALGVKIVLGVERDSQACVPPLYEGCIVARRRIHYAPHDRLVLPIALYVQCKDVPCDAGSTCNLLGQCVSATVDPGACSADHTCNASGDPQASMPPPSGDGGGDGAAADGNANGGDGATADASGAKDAALDASLDSGRDSATNGGTPAIVDCGTVTCNIATDGMCCWNSDTRMGSCATLAAGCPVAGVPNYTFACDGNEDCPGQVCCGVSLEETVCAADCGTYPVICHSTKKCATGACTGLFGGLYEMCQ